MLDYHMSDIIGTIDPPEANGKFYRENIVLSCVREDWEMAEEALRRDF